MPVSTVTLCGSTSNSSQGTPGRRRSLIVIIGKRTAGKEKAYSELKWHGLMDWRKLNIKMNMYLRPMDAKKSNEGWYLLLGILCDSRCVKCFTFAISFTLRTKTYNESIYFHYLTKSKDQKSAGIHPFHTCQDVVKWLFTPKTIHSRAHVLFMFQIIRRK